MMLYLEDKELATSFIAISMINKLVLFCMNSNGNILIR